MAATPVQEADWGLPTQYFPAMDGDLSSLRSGPGSGSQVIAVVQTTPSWHGYNLARCIWTLRCIAPSGRSLLQCEMRSVLVVVTNIFAHQPFQVPFIEYDDMIK